MNQRLYALIDEDLRSNKLTLPSLPHTALQIRTEIESGHSNVSRVVCLLAEDIALAAGVMQAANSPLLKTEHACQSLGEAVNRLGLEFVKSLVFSLSISQLFAPSNDSLEKRFGLLKYHSTKTAAYAYSIASLFTELKPETAHLIGLVHDIGTLPILAYVEQVPALIEDTELLDDFIKEETLALTLRVLRQWAFPEVILEAVAPQNIDPYTLKAKDYPLVLAAAHILANNDIPHDEPLSFGKEGVLCSRLSDLDKDTLRGMIKEKAEIVRPLFT